MEAYHIERFGSGAHRYLAGLPTPHGERERPPQSPQGELARAPEMRPF